ncbi:MAG TPA: protein kinase [Polyangiaceae bacterium]|nr:protein kinase [Polyangiaceae bacterium]
MESSPLLNNERLGEYELVRRLATGGMAEVYEARRVGAYGFSKRFALKRILPQLARDARLVQMFCHEARLHAALSHPNLVEVVDFGDNEGALYLVMEFVDGLSCADLFSAIAARRRKVELGPALFIAREVLAGLGHVHEFADESGRALGLVHRDVAPNNILIDRSGRVLLADFGIVRCAELDLRTSPGEIKGKLGYIAPEQALGAGVDARSDLFSLGVVLAELLLGEPLFPGISDIEILASMRRGDFSAIDRARHLPSSLKQVLHRALSRDANQRPSSARELASELEAIAKEHSAWIGADEFVLWLGDLGLISLKSGVESKRTLYDFGQSSEQPTAGVGALPRIAARTPLPANEVEEGPLYRIRRPGGTIVGPLRLARLLEMIATARAGADTEVSRSGAPFLALSAVHELGLLAARAPYRFFDPVALFASERHALDRHSLAWHLFRLAATRKTGLLCVRHGREQERIYLVAGAPAASSSTKPEELLGARLIRAGLVREAALDQAVEAAHRAGLPLGRRLLSSGLVSERDLCAALLEQRLARLTSLLGFRDGDLCFVENALSGEDALGQPVSATEFVAKAVRAAYSVAELRELLIGLAPSELSAQVAPLECRPILHLQRGQLGLSQEEAHAFDRAAGGVSPSAILKQARIQGEAAEAAALRALFLGLSSGAFSVARSR